MENLNLNCRNNIQSALRKILSLFIIFTFTLNLVIPPSYAQSVLNLPIPGTMVNMTPAFSPVIMRGITIHPEDALKFDFLIEKGDDALQDEEFKNEANKLIKYFLAALTVSEKEMWVNLSPYEKDRIIPQNFGQTEMGRDLLAQDYLLKQLTASLMVPDNDLGTEFWNRVHLKAKEKFGTEELPMNTFNKIWIVPEKAFVYEHEKGAIVVKNHLKVMLEEDYLALEANKNSTEHGLGDVKVDELKVVSGVQSQVIKEILIPEIEREVNEGKTFANLRQIFNSVILATWYKQALKDSLLGQVYVNQNKLEGVASEDKEINQKIYDQYVEAFKKGVFDLIKEEYDADTQTVIPRKYFSGGVVGKVFVDTTMPQEAAEQAIRAVKDIVPMTTELNPDGVKPAVTTDDAMLTGARKTIAGLLLASLLAFNADAYMIEGTRENVDRIEAKYEKLMNPWKATFERIANSREPIEKRIADMEALITAVRSATDDPETREGREEFGGMLDGKLKQLQTFQFYNTKFKVLSDYRMQMLRAENSGKDEANRIYGQISSTIGKHIEEVQARAGELGEFEITLTERTSVNGKTTTVTRKVTFAHLGPDLEEIQTKAQKGKDDAMKDDDAAQREAAISRILKDTADRYTIEMKPGVVEAFVAGIVNDRTPYKDVDFRSRFAQLALNTDEAGLSRFTQSLLSNPIFRKTVADQAMGEDKKADIFADIIRRSAKEIGIEFKQFDFPEILAEKIAPEDLKIRIPDAEYLELKMVEVDLRIDEAAIRAFLDSLKKEVVSVSVKLTDQTDPKKNSDQATLSTRLTNAAIAAVIGVTGCMAGGCGLSNIPEGKIYSDGTVSRAIFQEVYFYRPKDGVSKSDKIAELNQKIKVEADQQIRTHEQAYLASNLLINLLKYLKQMGNTIPQDVDPNQLSQLLDVNVDRNTSDVIVYFNKQIIFAVSGPQVFSTSFFLGNNDVRLANSTKFSLRFPGTQTAIEVTQKKFDDDPANVEAEYGFRVLSSEEYKALYGDSAMLQLDYRFSEELAKWDPNRGRQIGGINGRAQNIQSRANLALLRYRAGRTLHYSARQSLKFSQGAMLRGELQNMVRASRKSYAGQDEFLRKMRAYVTKVHTEHPRRYDIRYSPQGLVNDFDGVMRVISNRVRDLFTTLTKSYSPRAKARAFRELFMLLYQPQEYAYFMIGETTKETNVEQRMSDQKSWEQFIWYVSKSLDYNRNDWDGWNPSKASNPLVFEFLGDVRTRSADGAMAMQLADFKKRLSTLTAATMLTVLPFIASTQTPADAQEFRKLIRETPGVEASTSEGVDSIQFNDVMLHKGDTVEVDYAGQDRLAEVIDITAGAKVFGEQTYDVVIGDIEGQPSDLRIVSFLIIPNSSNALGGIVVRVIESAADKAMTMERSQELDAQTQVEIGQTLAVLSDPAKREIAAVMEEFYQGQPNAEIDSAMISMKDVIDALQNLTPKQLNEFIASDTILIPENQKAVLKELIQRTQNMTAEEKDAIIAAWAEKGYTEEFFMKTAERLLAIIKRDQPGVIDVDRENRWAQYFIGALLIGTGVAAAGYHLDGYSQGEPQFGVLFTGIFYIGMSLLQFNLSTLLSNRSFSGYDISRLTNEIVGSGMIIEAKSRDQALSKLYSRIGVALFAKENIWGFSGRQVTKQIVSRLSVNFDYGALKAEVKIKDRAMTVEETSVNIALATIKNNQGVQEGQSFEFSIEDMMVELSAAGVSASEIEVGARLNLTKGLQSLGDGRWKYTPVGGIDLNPTIMNTEIQKNGNGVIIPIPLQPIESFKDIKGITPNIINVFPATNLQLLLGMTGEADQPNSEKTDVSMNLSMLRADSREQYAVKEE